MIVILSFALWNLIYTQTAYRAPGEKRIDLYVQTIPSGNADGEAWARQIGKTAVPEVEEINLMTVMPPTAQDIYANVQLVTYLSAREGDIYVLGTEDFKRFAAQGAFMALDEAVAEGTISLADGADLRAGYLTLVETVAEGSHTSEAVSKLLGIPLADYPGLAKLLGLYRQDMFLSITHYCDNPESTMRFVNALFEAGNEYVNEV